MNAARTTSLAMQMEPRPLTSRSLGEDYSPPRAIYLTHIPALLVLTGLITWIASTELAMVVAAVVASLISLYLFWDWLLQEGPTRFSTIMAMVLLLGYGLGTMNTWLTLPRGGLSLAAYLGVDEGVLARGMAAVLFASAPLCFLGELYERPLFGREFRVPLDQRTYTLIYLGTLIVVAGFFTGAIGYMGAQNVYLEQQSPAAALIPWLFPAMMALTIAVFLVTPRGVTKLFVGACVLILCVLMMAVGRRTLIYTAMEVLLALRLTGYRLKGRLFKRVVLLAVLGVFLAIGVTVFMLLRLAGWENSHNPDKSLTQRVQVALSWVEDGTAISRATEANQNNAQRRTFVLGFFAAVLEGSSRVTPALGRDVAGYISVAIPRALNPDKDLTFSEEQLADELFGFNYSDEANSILTNGAVDFGFFGVLAYPLIVVLLFRFSIDVFAKFLPPLHLTIITLGVLFQFLQTENAVSNYLDALRSAIMIAIVLFIFSRLPRFRLRAG